MKKTTDKNKLRQFDRLLEGARGRGAANRQAGRDATNRSDTEERRTDAILTGGGSEVGRGAKQVGGAISEGASKVKKLFS